MKKDDKASAAKKAGKINTLAELNQICSAFKQITLKVGGQPKRDPMTGQMLGWEGGHDVDFKFRNLTPAEDAKLDEILSTVFPPVRRGKTPEEDRVEHSDADYIKKKTQAAIEVRALAIYWCVPMFTDANPNLKEKAVIAEFIQSQGNNDLLEALWSVIREGGISKVGEIVSFFSSETSRPS